MYRAGTRATRTWFSTRRRPLLLLLLCALLTSGAARTDARLADRLAEQHADWPDHGRCNPPISYRIEAVDTRFELDADTVRHAMRDAAAMWEAGTGQPLFVEVPGADAPDLTLALVYDGSQRVAAARREAEAALERTRADLERRQTEHTANGRALARDGADLARQADALERDAAAFQQAVQAWNARGAAASQPDRQALEAQRSALMERRRALERKQQTLNDRARALDDSAAQLEQDAGSLNQQITAHNSAAAALSGFEVANYSERGGERSITVYRMADTAELTVVLAHELGHALGIGHVDAEHAIMHRRLTGNNRHRMTLAAPDLAELERVCGDRLSD